MILIICTVGGVVINHKVRFPLMKQMEQRAHFRRICLHVITVQVQVMGSGSPACFGRANLIWAI